MHRPARRGEAPAAVPPGHYAAAGQPFFRPPPDRPSPTRPAPPGDHQRHGSAAPAPPPERPLPRPPGSDHRPVPPTIRTPDRPAPPAPPPPPPPGLGQQHAAYYPPAPPEPPLPRPRRASSALASCLVATAFLVLSAGGAGAALFLLFRPRPPDIAVAAVRLPSFAAANGTVAFTLEQTAAVRNPNRSPLAHFDSSLRVAYAGGELGSPVYIPAGLIDGGRTKDMSASFQVPAIPVAAPSQQPTVAQQMEQQPQPPEVIEVDSLLVVKGRVKMLGLLTHRVQAAKLCRVALSPIDGRVLGVRC
ncbi:hypothetical protein HU200_014790 [Digitaria exilis]|uniref:Late embryogenesis abundant protein LEA-2 subgroup domain-containing protein n=1 Tax=Digitaria exilis TaxID=1010633 RepID=A0A835FAT3_9POAL|nr:hypothetical protein HU200_014790 [Digitaria exilis]CAB3471615.1 unnamed protein product [Digitaria exilis]